METIDCIKSRRSGRMFLDKEIPDKIIRELIDCARCAPSSKNTQPWEFIVIKDKNIIKDIASIYTVYNDYKHMIGAPVLFVCCAKPEKSYELMYDHLFSTCAAVENILLSAHSLGLGACWTFCKSDNKGPEKTIKKMLNIPENIDVLCLIPMGYPHPDQRIDKKTLKGIDEITHSNKW